MVLLMDLHGNINGIINGIIHGRLVNPAKSLKKQCFGFLENTKKPSFENTELKTD